MSAWGDTLTEQLAHDILMDQQQAVDMALTPEILSLATRIV